MSSALPAFDGEGVQPRLAPLTLRLSLKGQLVQAYRLEQRIVTVGRDPNCDIFVDNPGVSRHHFQVECAESGEYRVVDGGSSNGTYLNERPVRIATLRTGDTIQFSKYAMDVNIEELVGDGGRGVNPRDRSSEGATVMLSPAEVRQIVSDSRAGATPKLVTSSPAPASPRTTTTGTTEARSTNSWLPWAIVAIALTLALVGGAAWMMTH